MVLRAPQENPLPRQRSGPSTSGVTGPHSSTPPRLVPWLVAFALVVAAVAVLARRDEFGVGPSIEPVAPVERVARSEGEGEAATAPLVRERSAPLASDVARPAVPTVDDAPLPASPTGTVVLRAYDVDTMAWLAEFTWTAVGTVRGLEPRGTGANQQAALSVPLRTPAAVVLEADGYFASLPVDVALHEGAFREVHTALVPRPARPGVRVVARDASGRAVDFLQVRCFARGADREAKSGFTEVYELGSRGEGGVHALPAPPEGWCRLVLTPRALDGAHSWLQPQELSFRHAEAKELSLDAIFEFGGGIAVDSRSDCGPLRLVDEHGRPVACAWIAGESRGEGMVQRIAEVLAPGRYGVEFGATGARDRRWVQVVVGVESSLVLH